jgi:hypothetical protein
MIVRTQEGNRNRKMMIVSDGSSNTIHSEEEGRERGMEKKNMVIP